jgi:hypothetical protein
MCTVTIHRGAERTLVTMNRDEARGRAEEAPPSLVEESGRPSWLAPTDGEKGGTWFGINDRGVAAGLLNAYVPGDLALYGRSDVPSRGSIIPELLGRDPEQGLSWLHHEFDPTPFPSFTLVVVGPGFAECFAWRLDGGVEITPVEDGWTMVTSSFWRGDDVVPWRHEAFHQWLEGGPATRAGIPTFNLLEIADMREWSPFATRSFSLTRSITQAEIRANESVARLKYWRREGENPITPDRPSASHTLRLGSFLNP